MLTREQAKKFVSEATHKALTKQLYLLEFPEQVKQKKNQTTGKTTEHIVVVKTEQIYQSLQTILERLFSYKDIFELHTDHLLELAETIVGLYPERENLSEYTYHILIYLEKSIQRYERKNAQKQQQLSIQRHSKKQDPIAYLDLKYEAWTYSDGYYYQQAYARRLLHRRLTELMEYDGKGLLWKRKRNA